MTQAAEIKEITRNIGILPVNMGSAKLQKSEHTFVHYYDLNPLYRELEKLDNQHTFLNETLKNILKFEHDFQNYNNIITFTRNAIIDKINNIKAHAVNKNRIKRGLVDGLGTVVKVITGNLDANDGKRIDEIIKHLQHNENNIKNQINLGYSVTTQIIKSFNDTLRNIEHNELILKSRIMQLHIVMKGEIELQNTLVAKDLFNQLYILYNTILNIFERIETSVSFCKLNVADPSIIKPDELFSELQKIAVHYNQQLPFELSIENIIDFESITKIHCKIELTKIDYFISIPINYEHEFDLYQLYSLPTQYESEYATIIPNTKFLLKSKNSKDIWPLNHECVKTIKHYQCPNYYVTSNKAECEKDILQFGSSSRCKYTTLGISENHLELLPMINQYLAVFPHREEIKIHCKQGSEMKSLVGIFLISQGSCVIYFRNKEIIYQDHTLGSPTLIASQDTQIKYRNFTGGKIHLHKLNLQEIPVLQQIPDIGTWTPTFYSPSLWTIVLYAVIIGTTGFLALKVIKKRRRSAPLSSPIDIDLQLPGGARI